LNGVSWTVMSAFAKLDWVERMWIFSRCFSFNNSRQHALAWRTYITLIPRRCCLRWRRRLQGVRDWWRHGERDTFNAVKMMEDLRIGFSVRCQSRPEVLIRDFRSQGSTYASSYVLKGMCMRMRGWYEVCYLRTNTMGDKFQAIFSIHFPENKQPPKIRKE